MTEHFENNILDPTAALEGAIQELAVFTQDNASRLELGNGGVLIAKHDPGLKRIARLAHTFIGPYLSEKIRSNQGDKIAQLKKALLRARDYVQSHAALIEKLKLGDQNQQKLADYALETIQKYNAFVEHRRDHPLEQMYNYERNQLLADHEIVGNAIKLPATASIKYDSDAHVHFAHRTLKELRGILLGGCVAKSEALSSSTPKKTVQFMLDTFRMKGIRLVQAQFSEQSTLSEITHLIKQTDIQIDLDGCEDSILMRQLIEESPGSYVLLSGSYKKNDSDPKFLKMPIIENLSINLQTIHSGYPYASQHCGWALADRWVDAHPLRVDQAPQFYALEQRRKELSKKLLFDRSYIDRSRHLYRLCRSIFDQKRSQFLLLHRQLIDVIIDDESIDKEALESFFQLLQEVPSAYDVLSRTYQQMMNLYVTKPFGILEEEWLVNGKGVLRVGSPQDRYHTAEHIFESEREKVKQILDLSNARHAFILCIGPLFSKRFQAIALQYLSEKIGFAPPLFRDNERKLQICAFAHLRDFIQEWEGESMTDPEQVEKYLVNVLKRDISFLREQIDGEAAFEKEKAFLSSIAIADELESYFNFRFFGNRRSSSMNPTLI